MKCTTIERWILQEKQPNSRTAEQSNDEQSNWRTRRIETHIESCASCRQWREDLRTISAMAQAGLSSGEPSSTVLTNIRREARIRAAESHNHANGLLPSFVGRLPAVALAKAGLFACSIARPSLGIATVAALCLVLVGAWWLRPDPNGFGADAQLSAILLMLSEETTDLDSDSESPTSDMEALASLDALAQQLLTLQGLDDSYTEAELSTQDEELQATDPLTHSSDAFRAERYG